MRTQVELNESSLHSHRSFVVFSSCYRCHFSLYSDRDLSVCSPYCHQILNGSSLGFLRTPIIFDMLSLYYHGFLVVFATNSQCIIVALLLCVRAYYRCILDVFPVCFRNVLNVLQLCSGCVTVTCSSRVHCAA